MGVLSEAGALVQKYPLTFLGVGVASLVVTPVLAVAMAGAFRPLARRILSSAFALRREARRVMAESKEGWADLVAEALREGDAAERQPTRKGAAAPGVRDKASEPLAAPRSVSSVA